MLRSIALPRSRKVFAALGAAAIGLTITATAASGASLAPPTEADHQLRVSSAAVTANPELLYVAITPCRIVDTRGAVGPFSSGQTRNYYVGGTFGFAPQGGRSGGCGIPEGAQAVAAVVTAVSPAHAGYVRAWPAGSAEPGATLLNYATNNIGIGGQVKLRSGAGTDMSVKNYGGPTQIVIDVNGYYIQQLQAYIASGGSVIDQSGRLVSATKNSTGVYTLTWDRSVDTCSGQGSSDLTGHIVSVYTSGNNSYVYIVNNAGTPEDYWVNVDINC
jgi:hypothetical protein